MVSIYKNVLKDYYKPNRAVTCSRNPTNWHKIQNPM